MLIKRFSVLSPCLGLCWWFLWARQAKGNLTRNPVQHPTASECTPGLCLQQCRVLPKPPWFSHSNPLFHPSSHAPWWSSPSCRYLPPDAVIPLPNQRHLLSPSFLFSELVPWLLPVRWCFLLIVAPIQIYWLNMCEYGLYQGTVLSL